MLYLQFSVTCGIVSAVNRPAPSSDARRPGGLIQTDAAVNPGNSGGPLVNSHGELIGINFLIASTSGQFAGASFAIPAEIAKSVTSQIIRTGTVHHGYLGIGMNDVTPENAQFFSLKNASGAIVSQVSPQSPAAAAGLQHGDVIQRLNGNAVENGSALQVAVSEIQPGTRVQLGILRNGTPQTVSLTVGEYNRKAEVAANDGDGTNGTNPNSGKLGLAMADLTPDLRGQLNVPAAVNGAAVQNVRNGSPAEDAGLQPGDIIVEVNRHAVTSASQAVSGVKQASGGDVLLLVWSQGGESYRVIHPHAG